jgi:ABC-type transport system substrate-binding protein
MRGHSRRTVALAVSLALGAGACTSGGPSTDRSPQASGGDSTETTVQAGPDEPYEAAPDVLRVGLTGVQSIDPVNASPASITDVALADLFYDGLTSIGNDGTTVPALADFAVNAEGDVWRFTLRDGATFTDGSAITAADVVFSLDRIRERADRSLAALRLEEVKSITAVDERTIDIATTGPSAVLPELLASPLYAITDQETIEPYLAGGDQTPNGSGDHEVTIESDRRLLLDRVRGEGPKRVVVDLFDTQDAALDAFLEGEVDWTVAPSDRLGEATADAGTDGLVPFHGGLLLGVNPTASPLDNGALRRAIALAIDREALVDAVFGPSAQPFLGLLPVGVPGAAEACTGPCGPDLDQARALVGQAFPDGKPVPLQILVDDSSAQQSAAGVLEEELEAIGLDVTTESLDVEAYESAVAGGKQQLFLYGSLGVALTPASHLPPLLRSKSPDNLIGLKNADIDAAIGNALAQQIPAARLAAWREIERAALESAVTVPLAQFRTTGVSRPGIRGLVVRSDGSLDLSGVAIERSGG